VDSKVKMLANFASQKLKTSENNAHRTNTTKLLDEPKSPLDCIVC
jgi:hypothetical protein